MNSNIGHLTEGNLGTREYFWTIAGFKGDLNLARYMKSNSTSKPSLRAVDHVLMAGYADVFAVFVEAGFECTEQVPSSSPSV